MPTVIDIHHIKSGDITRNIAKNNFMYYSWGLGISKGSHGQAN